MLRFQLVKYCEARMTGSQFSAMTIFFTPGYDRTAPTEIPDPRPKANTSCASGRANSGKCAISIWVLKSERDDASGLPLTRMQQSSDDEGMPGTNSPCSTETVASAA